MFDLERDIYGGHWNYVFSRLTDNITNEGWQDHATPKIVCNMLLEKYEYKQTDKILVLFNAEIINALHAKYADEIIYSNIYYIADTEKKNNYIKKYLPKINCKYLNKENWSADKLIKTIKEFNMPKHFDVVFTNPPYNGNLDLKLINSLIDNNIADKIICVHPGAYIFNHNNNKDIEKLKHSNMLKDVTLFWGNEMFDTGLKHVHCISIWDKKYKNNIVTIHDHAFTERKDIFNVDNYTYKNNVNEITIHSLFAKKAWTIYKNIITRDSIANHKFDINKKKTPYGFKFSAMRRGFDYKKNRNYGEFFSCFGNTELGLNNALIDDNYVWTGVTKGQFIAWYFNTEEERQNFINYLKTKSVRFLLSLTKVGTEMNGGKPYSIIPWMDFTKHYTEEDLKKAWGIDDELWDYINKFIPDYYEDYKEIAK